MHYPHANARKQLGIATIEFAICAPLLFFLMFATAELGRAIFQYNTLVKAVRDGARYVVNNASVGTTRVVNITRGTTQRDAQFSRHRQHRRDRSRAASWTDGEQCHGDRRG